MHHNSKAKGASRGSKGRFLHVVSESARDVYDFDQQDASRISTAGLQSKELMAEFRSPRRIKTDARPSRKCTKHKMLSSANVEANYSGKTSTPCTVMGQPKTKKKTPGTPAPWVVLPRMQQSSLEAYAVSPIAVEHHSLNDLSRQVDVNSMFDDTSSVIYDSAVCIPKSESDIAGSDENNELSVPSFSKVPSSTQSVVEDVNGQQYSCEKHKSDTDSGYPKFDSQCDFISLSARDNVAMATEGSRPCADVLQKVNIPVLQDMDDSGDNQNIVSATKQALAEVTNFLSTDSENRSGDSDCEMVLYKRGMLNPKKFNLSDVRSSRKISAKRCHQLYEDVEPSDTSDDSDAVVSSGLKSTGKLTRSVDDITSLHDKPSHVQRTRNTAMDSDSASASSAHGEPSTKYSRKANEATESAEMPSEKCLNVKKLGNTADDGTLEKPKSRHRQNNKNNARTGSRKQAVDQSTASGPESEKEGMFTVASSTTSTCMISI